ncbi:MAG: hypothetical protein RLZZ511_4397 [Cyanobacteriota bacterium]|jgi:hypothetical protein
MKKQSKSQPKKRLVMITGDKGGTGKSTFARGLLDIYRYQDIACRAYDGDRRNAQLYRHYQNTDDGVTEIDIATQGAADELLDSLESNPAPITMIDMPAGSGKWFEALDRDVELIQTAAEWDCRLTLVSVMSPVKDSINALRILMDYCDDRVDYIAVKNLQFGEEAEYEQFRDSKTHERFLTHQGREITMPKLFRASYNLVDKHDLTFRAAAQTGSLLTLSHRSRVNQWLRQLEPEISQAGIYLGMGG